MRRKVYLDASETTSVELIFVHPDYEVSASGAKSARDDGIHEVRTLILANTSEVQVCDPAKRRILKT